MARKTKTESEETRKKILDSAEILFYEKGVSSTSLADIAEYAGLTRGAIYWHFKNKVDLFDAMHGRIALPLENMHAETLGRSNQVLALRDFWIRSILQVLEDDSRRRVVDILFRKCEYVQEFESASNRMEQWSSIIIEKMTEIFFEASRNKLLGDGISPETASISTYVVIVGIMHSWTNRILGKTDKCDIVNIINLYFRSLLKSPGEDI